MRNFQLLQRLRDVLIEYENGKVTSEQAMKKLIRCNTKYMQSRFKEEKSD